MDNSKYYGIINIIKPPNMTSFDVIGYLRKKTRIKKIGHTGTLDPLAVGVLTICIGKYTKLIELLVEKNKRYRVEMRLGKRTTTLDSEGEITEKRSIEGIKKEDILECFNHFKGNIRQKPPMYSAIKINGKKLYELARKGITIDREYRNVNIEMIKLIDIKGEYVIFDVVCSKGTYVRTLCDDIGLRLGCGAYMNFLLRTELGNFSLNDSYILEEVDLAIEEDRFEDLLLGTEVVFDKQKKVVISSDEEKRFKNGGFINSSVENNFNVGTKNIPILNTEKEFLGLGEFVIRDNRCYIKPKKVF